MRTAVGLFDTFGEAQSVVDDLVTQGFNRNDISIVSNDSGRDVNTTTTTTDSNADGAATGALVGGGIGAVAGLVVLAIPGIGPVVAAGPLLAALGGAGIGAVTGGIIGGLADAGVPQDDAELYAEGVRRGGALVTVTADDTNADAAIGVMNRHNAVNVDERSQGWRNQGWTGYEPNAEPYSAVQVEAERVSRNQLAAGDLSGRYEEYMGKNVTGHGRTDNIGEPTTNAMGAAEEAHRDFQNQDARDAQHSNRVRHYDTLAQGMRANRNDDNIVEDSRNYFGQPTTHATQAVEEIDEDFDRQGSSYQAQSDRVTYYDTPVQSEARDAGMDADLAHYQENYARSGTPYNDYTPAYTYGRALAADDRYQGREWNDIQSDARREWERDNPDTWDRYSDAMQNAFGRARINQ